MVFENSVLWQIPTDRRVLILNQVLDGYLNKTRDNILDNGKISFAALDDEKGFFPIKGKAEMLKKGLYVRKFKVVYPKKCRGVQPL